MTWLAKPSEIARRKPRPSLHQDYRDLPIADVRPTDRQARIALLTLLAGVLVLGYAIVSAWGRA